MPDTPRAAVTNAEIAARFADREALVAALPDLERQLAALTHQATLARLVGETTLVHDGVAIAVATRGHDTFVAAVGAGIVRNAFLFRDARNTGESWSARLRQGGDPKSRAKDPGSFDFPDRAAALAAALDWVATGAAPPRGLF